MARSPITDRAECMASVAADRGLAEGLNHGLVVHSGRTRCRQCC